MITSPRQEFKRTGRATLEESDWVISILPRVARVTHQHDSDCDHLDAGTILCHKEHRSLGIKQGVE